jgi:hypothetical protein
VKIKSTAQIKSKMKNNDQTNKESCENRSTLKTDRHWKPIDTENRKHFRRRSHSILIFHHDHIPAVDVFAPSSADS